MQWDMVRESSWHLISHKIVHCIDQILHFLYLYFPEMLNVAMWETCRVLCLYRAVPREGDAPFTPFLNPHHYSSSEGCYFCFTYLWNNLPCSKLILSPFTTITTMKCPQKFITQHFFLWLFVLMLICFCQFMLLFCGLNTTLNAQLKMRRKKYIFEVLVCFLEIQH